MPFSLPQGKNYHKVKGSRSMTQKTLKNLTAPLQYKLECYFKLISVFVSITTVVLQTEMLWVHFELAHLPLYENIRVFIVIALKLM